MPNTLWIIIAAAFVVRLCFLGFDGFHNDVQTFEAWTLTLRDYPLSSFYARAGFADYPPGYLYILTLLARIYAVVGTNDGGYAILHALVKLPGVVFDLINAVLSFVLVRRFVNDKRALTAAACVALNPATIFISAFWGQVDSVAASLVLVALLAVDSGMRRLWSPLVVAMVGWSALAVSVLIKPPALLLAPLLLAWTAALIKTQGHARRLERIVANLVGITFALLVTYALAIPFAPGHPAGGIVGWLIQRYQFGSNVYPYNSINAFNLYSIVQPFWVADSVRPIAALSFTQANFGAGLVVISTLAFALRFIALGTPLAALEAAGLTLLGFFMLATRMHERYIFDAVLLLTLLGGIVQRYRPAAIALSVTLFANLWYSLHYLNIMTASTPGADPRNLAPWLSIPCSLLNVAVFVYLALHYFGVLEYETVQTPVPVLPGRLVGRGAALKSWYDRVIAPSSRGKFEFDYTKFDWLLTAGFIVLSFVLCIIAYGTPSEKIFDEIYYARSGEEYLKHIEQFEWTHPPLTKLIITCSMLLFGGLHGGDSSYGWRFLNVVIGALMVGLLYAFTKRLSGSTLIASFAAIFLTFDGFHFVQSRIATPEITVAFFCLATLYTFYRFWVAQEAVPEVTAAIDRRTVLGFGAACGTAMLGSLAFSGLLGTKPGQIVPVWMPPLIVMLYAGCGAYMAMRLLIGRRSTAANAWFAALTLSAGCLAASKWNGLFDFFVVWICAALVTSTRWIPALRGLGKAKSLPLDLLVTGMLFIGGTIYVLSYIPYFLLGHSFFDMLVLQHSMYAYHSDLRATHPYASAWWQWPILQRPISYYYHDFRVGAQATKDAGCCVAEILALPNPLVWWAGLVSVPAIAVMGWVEKRRGYLLLVLAYFMQWLPWIASPRIAFEYHFFPNLAIICCCNALVLQRLWRSADAARGPRAWQKVSCIAMAVLAIVAFVYWYPIVSGTHMSYHDWYQRVLTWVPFVHWI